MFRNELVPVVNMGLLLSNEVDDSFIMLVLDTVNVLAIMVTEIREVIRDQIPEDYEFLDINDIAQQVIAGPRSEEDQHIELF